MKLTWTSFSRPTCLYFFWFSFIWLRSLWDCGQCRGNLKESLNLVVQNRIWYRRGAVERDLGARMEVLLQEGGPAGREVSGSTSEWGNPSRKSSVKPLQWLFILFYYSMLVYTAKALFNFNTTLCTYVTVKHVQKTHLFIKTITCL